jgi:hypothetical protein
LSVAVAVPATAAVAAAAWLSSQTFISPLAVTPSPLALAALLLKCWHRTLVVMQVTLHKSDY